MTLMMAAMGLDATVATNPEDAEAAAAAAAKDMDSRPAKPKEEPKAKEPEPVPEILTDEEKEKKQKRAESDKEKDLGNKAYKQRNFDEALAHYDKAFELDPTNLAVLTNKAAALYEAVRYDDCIKTCEEAVEIGREQRADYKIIAK